MTCCCSRRCESNVLLGLYVDVCRRKKPIWSGGERLSIKSRDGSNIRGDLTQIREISIQLLALSAVISVTHCKFLSLNLEIITGESRQTLIEYFMSISVWRCVLPHNFHSSLLCELSMKGSIDEHPGINPASIHHWYEAMAHDWGYSN